MSEEHRRSALVDSAEAGATLAAVVRRAMDGLPWSKSRSLISTGRVRVNGVPNFDPVHRVVSGDHVEVDPTGRRRRVPELEAERILFVDHDIVVVDKPSGLISVPYDERDIDSLLARTEAQLKLSAPSRGGAKPNTTL